MTGMPRKAAGAGGVLALAAASTASAQPRPPPFGSPNPPPLSGMRSPGQPGAGDQQPVGVESYAGGGNTGKLLGTPVTGVFPGNVPVDPQLKCPVGRDPQAIQRGMQYFTIVNCVGCHAPNGAGGMGPSLSGRPLTYGVEPAQDRKSTRLNSSHEWI